MYERWLTLYPLMELGTMKYISFKEYKEKIIQKAKEQQHNEMLTDEQIIDQGMKIVEAYESQQKKAGGNNGNI